MLAMVSMFIATTAFAASYGTSGFEGQNALNNPPTVTGQFTVYLSVKSNSIDGVAISRHRLPITMGTPGVTNYFFVSDVLVAAMSQYPALSFQNSSGIPITSTSSYVQKVTDSTVSSTLVFEPVTGINYYNGWMFRINDKYRAMNPADWPAGWDEDVSGPYGAAINQAFVQPDDFIDFYFADSANATVATRTLKASGFTYTSGINKKLDVTLSESHCYFDGPPNYKWYATTFAVVPNVTFSVKIDGTTYTDATNANGVITINGIALSSGTHTFEVLPIYNTYTVNGTYHMSIPLYSGYYATFTI